MRDLTESEYLPVELPLWLREAIPSEMEPFRGINGMPLEWQKLLPSANAIGTAGIDRFQANQFICWRPETAQYLESEYTPLTVQGSKGLFPVLEAAGERAVYGCDTLEAKVEALLQLVSSHLKHPYIPPFSPSIAANRNLGDDALFESGAAWCNEQVRVFVRLCQLQRIPTRIIHLFFTTAPNGHTVAEFHNGHQWCMADASYRILFRDENGKPLSAAQCHDRGAGQQRFGALFHARLQEMIRATPRDNERCEGWCKSRAKETPESCSATLDWFGVINYPLPPCV